MNKQNIKNTIKLIVVMTIVFLSLLSVDGAIFKSETSTSEEPTMGFFSESIPYVSADNTNCPGLPGGCH